MGMNKTVYNIDRVRGMYGPHGGCDGVLSEHVHHVEQAGGFVRTDADGAWWTGFEGGEYALPVLCSEVVQGWDADGVPQSARCGAPVVGVGVWCEGHELTDEGGMDEVCPHGMAAWLCEDPVTHYGLD